jgi:hypothetical protein
MRDGNQRLAAQHFSSCFTSLPVPSLLALVVWLICLIDNSPSSYPALSTHHSHVNLVQRSGKVASMDFTTIELPTPTSGTGVLVGES